ncbi:WecB/TagA/CpsF family glycosyltransferase [Cerasicoccus fimbriatus]|uniref:WecB/TagA/CpsF family glycosyltransferase n=1 Tax=Cerasicoccus fimbriatus TaxID=3014554 RepID=UPI0022B41FC6|nr:WecB/TagA/CpsF family glycosyltransferase [Cerasicoccus sp. TK19100]
MSPPNPIDPLEPPIAVLLGLPFHDLTMEEALEECRRALNNRRADYFVTANVDFAAQAYEDEHLRKILFYAKRVVCDGMPLVWISRILGHPLRERIAGSDLTPKLLEICAQTNKRVYFFGSDDKTLGETVEILKDKMPDLEIAGFESPPMGKVQDWDNEGVVQRIQDAKTDLLLVALGCPKQEDWIYLFHQRTGAALSIGIGASLDFVSGKQVRAPMWMQKTGLEWLWRLGTNPKRLLSRYTRDFFFLAWVTLQQWLSKRRREPAPAIKPAPEPTPAEYQRLVWHGSAERATIDQLPVPDSWDQPVLLDMSDVDFIDSAGMGALAGMARQAREHEQSFAILSAADIVVKALKAVRLDSLFEFYQNEADYAIALTTGATATTEATEALRYQLKEIHDNTNYKHLTQQLTDLIDANPSAKLLLIDASKVVFVDSSGITALLTAYRRMNDRGGKVELIAPSPPVKRIVHLLRLTEFLPEHREGKVSY